MDRPDRTRLLLVFFVAALVVDADFAGTPFPGSLVLGAAEALAFGAAVVAPSLLAADLLASAYGRVAG
ncbi:hypothetical protein [Halobaculum lipolyticum]|uniref:Uncharacterized protein n=1 Tax=Halobaculum lipolyticum TaxID=3032001 RepID=A0ABD5WCH7_9EURY|nr:hypothetical protein [Halobaculum sp. DT31]